MENKKVGWLIIGLSGVMIAIIGIFNNAMKRIIDAGCPLVENHLTCPAYTTIDQQTYLSLAIVGIVIILGLVFMFTKPQEKIVYKKFKKESKKIDLSNLTTEEKEVLKMIESEKAMFQAELIEKTRFGKVKISRILDRLDNRGITERKRRGMQNIVVLKD